MLTSDKPQPIRFSATAKQGLHIALLQLRDAATDVVMWEIPLTVRAPAEFQRVGGGVEMYKTSIAPRRFDRFYIYLPFGVQAAEYGMEIPYAGQSLISIRDMPEFAYGVVGRDPINVAVPHGSPVDAAHHVGPVEHFESLVPVGRPGIQTIYWENRGRPSVETEHDPAAPAVPISATLTVAPYAVEFRRQDANHIEMFNRLAEIQGTVELFDASTSSAAVTGNGNHASVDVERTLPSGVVQWRVRISNPKSAPESADAFLLDCTRGDSACSVVAQDTIGKDGATLHIDNPKQGAWRILIRSRMKVENSVPYTITEALLTPVSNPLQPASEKYRSGSVRSFVIPPNTAARYAGFRIAKGGAPTTRDSVLIGITPVD